ncbi:hypothetical protein EJB05_52031, partial [Eragrostis curvula]
MASFNNRHWPSMFRSKHAAQPWQTQPDVSGSPPSLVSGGSTTTTTTGSSIKHSFPVERGREYGPVGDANVFYWFQNRKARSKNKLRAGSGGGSTGRMAPARAPPPARLQPVAHALYTPPPQIHAQHVQLFASPVQAPVPAPTSSSSSSSDRSSGSSRPASKPPQAATMSATEAMDLLGPLAAACPQVYSYQTPPSAAPSPKVQLDHAAAAADETIFVPWPQGYCLSAAELAAILGAQYMHLIHARRFCLTVSTCNAGLADHGVTGGAPPAPAADSATALVVAAAPADHDEGVAVLCVGDSATGRSVVREVAARHLDVRAQFGDAAVLFRYVGDGERPAVHVPVDAATGCTVEPLQHGVVYWVLV